jgi:hypothetical protein
MAETLSWLAQLLGAAIIGALIGSFVTHRLTLSRERDSRQHAQDTARKDREREFRSLIVHFRSEAADPHWLRGPTNILGTQTAFRNHYQSKTAQFRSAAANVANDFGNRRAEFERLVDVTAGFAPEEVDTFHGRQQLVVALDDILNFLNKA